jgi:gliding motility-associated lipoprotein GldH
MQTKVKIVTLKKMRNFYVILIAMGILFGCQSNVALSETQSIQGNWKKEDSITFKITPKDSINHYNLYLLLRNTNQYKYNNIFLIASISFPHGKTITDTLEYRMANPDGTWLGTGLGNTKENKLWYKEHVRFSEKGTYTLTIKQAVRNNGEANGVSKLEGITDVGYILEEIKNN